MSLGSWLACSKSFFVLSAINDIFSNASLDCFLPKKFCVTYLKLVNFVYFVSAKCQPPKMKVKYRRVNLPKSEMCVAYSAGSS